MKLNTVQLRERDGILGFSTAGSDFQRFADMDAATVAHLISQGYMDPEGRQNDSPTMGEFLAFMEKNPTATANGYVVGGDRDDARVTIEGLWLAAPFSHEAALAFALCFRHADELEAGPDWMRCWYD